MIYITVIKAVFRKCGGGIQAHLVADAGKRARKGKTKAGRGDRFFDRQPLFLKGAILPDALGRGGVPHIVGYTSTFWQSYRP